MLLGTGSLLCDPSCLAYDTSGCSDAPVCGDEVDDFVRATMEEQNIPGIAIAVVRDGKPARVHEIKGATGDTTKPQFGK